MNIIQQQKYGVVVYGPVNLMHITAFMELTAKMLKARKSSLVLDALISYIAECELCPACAEAYALEKTSEEALP